MPLRWSMMSKVAIPKSCKEIGFHAFDQKLPIQEGRLMFVLKLKFHSMRHFICLFYRIKVFVFPKALLTERWPVPNNNRRFAGLFFLPSEKTQTPEMQEVDILDLSGLEQRNVTFTMLQQRLFIWWEDWFERLGAHSGKQTDFQGMTVNKNQIKPLKAAWAVFESSSMSMIQPSFL